MRSAIAILLVLSLVGCKSDESPAAATCGAEAVLVDGACRAPGVPEDGCAAGFQWSAGGCSATLPASCPPANRASLSTGTCEPVGIPACADGFARSDEGSCSPVLPGAPCARGTFAVPGDTVCRTTDVCGTDAFPEVPGEALFVDAAATDGGDGTRARPLRSVAAAVAVAKDGGTVAIAAGTYAENLVLARSLTLVGRCSAQVELRAADPKRPAIEITGGTSTIRGLGVTGATGTVAGVEVGAASATLTGLWIHDVDGPGVRTVQTSAKLVMASTLVESAANVGVAISGGTVSLDSTAVRETRPRADGERGIGVMVEQSSRSVPAAFTARRLVVDRNADVGVLVHGSDAVLEQTVIVDTKPRVSGVYGVGLNALGYSDAKLPRGRTTLRDSWISGSSYAGILVGGVPVIVERSVVRDTKPQPSRPAARGVVVQEHPGSKLRGELVMRSSVVERNVEIGVVASSSSVTVEDSIVRTTVPRADGTLGIGVVGQISSGRDDPPEIKLVRTLVDDNRELGVYGNGALITLDGCTVRRTRPAKTGGWGVHLVRDDKNGVDGELVVTGSVIEDNVESGVFTYQTKATIAGSLVRAVGAGSEAVTASCVAARGTDAARGTLTVKSSVIEDCEDTAVLSMGARVILEATTIRRPRPRASTGLHGTGIVLYLTDDGVPSDGVLRGSLLEDASGAAVIIGGSTTIIEDVLVRDVRPEPATSTFGDGVVVRARGGVRGSLTLRRSTVLRASRAAVAVFGSDAVIGASKLWCASFAIDAETSDEQSPALIDEQGNVCGCGEPGRCVAVSAKLAPMSIDPQTGSR
ncbi:MAG: DUF1565 domain-containing protein [Deltaproteobacteria bacterium]|nr:DUF1565 domain-containing protein [Deltaproteobacteria bacterium]